MTAFDFLIMIMMIVSFVLHRNVRNNDATQAKRQRETACWCQDRLLHARHSADSGGWIDLCEGLSWIIMLKHRVSQKLRYDLIKYEIWYDKIETRRSETLYVLIYAAADQWRCRPELRLHIMEDTLNILLNPFTAVSVKALHFAILV